ncbi:hypothetical protein SIO17_05395 [Pseudoalteromonas piscicida]|uniref:Uncharacterized protein n=1 Tax=Pseudoalteromonas piscicida TaxID=43662 RepID=A0ABN5CA13_PSEO7|nr:hypothetical protein [Pseudoalteromonas piscicida]ATD06444.1 hypothetical protein PPIS_a1302 [Pseudoalteromonas piscicida]WPU33161.1 hypothetical protein SIO17_05395 [Pseudoalteromonas piscicida]
MQYLSLFIGYILFIPFIFFYSYILGPALKMVLIPGGLVVLCLIMGPKTFFSHFNRAKALSIEELVVSK